MAALKGARSRTPCPFVVSTAKVAGLREESLGRKKKILAIGLPLAALTGYFRVAAGNHYLTDVLTGAVVGSSLGVLVPKWHVNLGGNRDVSVMPASIQGGGAIMVTW